MWSVWAETLDIYLCRGTVWGLVPGAGAMPLRLPATLPLAGQLQRVSELLAPHLKKRVDVRVSLGARLCPPVCYEVPRGLRWSEQQWLAQKAAAQAWGLNPAEVDQLVCVLSASTVGLAAALPKTTLEVVHQWARSTHQARVTSIAPMWAHMSGHGSLNRNGGVSLEVVEPDGTRALLQGTHNGCSAQLVDAHANSGTPVNASAAAQHARSTFTWSDALAGADALSKRRTSWRQCFERQTA